MHKHKWPKWEDVDLTIKDEWDNRIVVSAQRRRCLVCNKKKVRKV